MTRKYLNLVCIVCFSLISGFAIAQTVINQAAVVAGGITPGDAAGFPATISVSGAYILTGNLDTSISPSPTVNGIVITADDVTLDMNGFVVSAANTCTKGATGNSCVGSLANAQNLISVSGHRVTIKNGSVRGSRGNGIQTTGDTTRLDGLMVSNNAGHGILGLGDAGVTLTNSSMMLNGKNGFSDSSFNGGTRLANSTFSYNGGGMSLFLGVGESLIANSNAAWGISTGNATVVKSNAFNNGTDGFSGGGVVRDSVSAGNLGSGFNSNSGPNALYINNSAELNSANGFIMNAGDCYSNIEAAGNSVAQISGGTALTGTHVTCP